MINTVRLYTPVSRQVKCNLASVVNYKAGEQYKFCRNCKYYKHASQDYCTYYGKINLVSGEVSYEYASIAREYECKGEKYEDKPHNTNANNANNTSANANINIGDAKGTSP